MQKYKMLISKSKIRHINTMLIPVPLVSVIKRFDCSFVVRLSRYAPVVRTQVISRFDSPTDLTDLPRTWFGGKSRSNSVVWTDTQSLPHHFCAWLFFVASEEWTKLRILFFTLLDELKMSLQHWLYPVYLVSYKKHNRYCLSSVTLSQKMLIR